jgi:hypothetical protein
MSDLVEKYNARVQRDKALFEEKCKKMAYAAARKLVKNELQEKYELNEEQAESVVNNKVSLIKKYANRLLPKVKQAQMNRHGSFHTGSKIENLGQGERLEVNEHINALFTEKFAPSTGMSAGEEHKAQSLKGDNVPQDPTQKRAVVIQPPVMNKQPQVVFNPPDRRVDNPKIQNALGKKADQSNTPDVILREVFVRGLDAWTEQTGVSPEQYGFARVNSFINGGKAYKELDADLVGIDESVLAGLGAAAVIGGTGAGVGALRGVASRALQGAKLRLSGEAGEAADKAIKQQKDKNDKARKKREEDEDRAKQGLAPKYKDEEKEEEDAMSSGEAKSKYINRKLGGYRKAAVDGGFGGAGAMIKARPAVNAGAASAPSGPAVANFGPPSGLQR